MYKKWNQRRHLLKETLLTKQHVDRSTHEEKKRRNELEL